MTLPGHPSARWQDGQLWGRGNMNKQGGLIMIHHLDSSVHGLGNKADPLRPFKKNVTFVFAYPLFLYISERGGFKRFFELFKNIFCIFRTKNAVWFYFSIWYKFIIHLIFFRNLHPFINKDFCLLRNVGHKWFLVVHGPKWTSEAPKVD